MRGLTSRRNGRETLFSVLAGTTGKSSGPHLDVLNMNDPASQIVV